jgi:uncharacterized membrane protein YjfL (UPF0719 family)
MILVSINLMLHTSSRASISIIAMLTWAAAGLLNGIMAVTYIREFKKKYKKENK